MRRNAPLHASNAACMSKDMTVAGVHLQKDEAFYIMIQQVQNDPKQWKEPKSFIPERFDVKSHYYEKPGGGKRNPFAFSPFLGGSRGCLGKTFAETTLKFVIPLWYHFFDF